jgi:hypothetical protein
MSDGGHRCIAIKSGDHERCEYTTQEGSDLCGVHQNADFPATCIEASDKRWGKCPECGWYEVSQSEGNPPHCGWCGVELPPDAPRKDGGGETLGEEESGFMEGKFINMTTRELRAKVGRIVGTHQNPDSALHKNTLNSAYAYLTGEFLYPRRARHRQDSPDFVPRKEALVSVVAACGGIAHPDDERWMRDYEDLPEALKWDELLELVVTLMDEEDQRHWTNPDVQEGEEA